MSAAILCQRCGTADATIQEKRGDKLAFCGEDCQRIYHTGQPTEAALIGYGLFGFIRGPPDNPDQEPPLMNDLFYEIVKQGLTSIKVASVPLEGPATVGGGITLLAAVVAENLEMMFLPADANDQGFTPVQRQRVFERLFSPKYGKGLRTALGVMDMREFKQRVFIIATRRGYYHTAQYLWKKMRSKPWSLFTASGDETLEFFNLLNGVPLDRRVPTLSWLIDALGTDALMGANADYVLTYLSNAVVWSKDVALFAKLYPALEKPAWWCQLLDFAVEGRANAIAELILTRNKPKAFYQCDVLLHALRVEPYDQEANAMVTLIANHLDPYLMIRHMSIMQEAMRRDRVDVFEKIVNVMANVSPEMRISIGAAAVAGDHLWLRMYAKAPYVADNYKDFVDMITYLAFNAPTEDLGPEIWQDIDLLLQRRPVDERTPLIKNAYLWRSPRVLTELLLNVGSPMTLLVGSVMNNDGSFLSILLQEHKKRYALTHVEVLRLLQRAAEAGSIVSLNVLRQDLKLSDEEILRAASQFGTASFLVEVLSLVRANQQVIRDAIQPAVLASRQTPSPQNYESARTILGGLLVVFPDLMWDNWDYWRPYYGEFGLVNEAKAFEDRHQRRDTGKAPRQVERRLEKTALDIIPDTEAVEVEVPVNAAAAAVMTEDPEHVIDLYDLHHYASSLRDTPLVKDAIVDFQARCGGVYCEGCGKADGSAGKCKGCHLASYCSIECQKRDWKEGGHSVECDAIIKGELIAGNSTLELRHLTRCSALAMAKEATQDIKAEVPTLDEKVWADAHVGIFIGGMDLQPIERNWMQGAVKHPGSFNKAAAHADHGKWKGRTTAFAHHVLRNKDHKHGSGLLRKRASLALTFARFRHHGHRGK
jgi:hypothetical protein